MMVGSLLVAAAVALAGATAFDAQAIPKARADIALACNAEPAIVIRWDAFGDDANAADALITNGLGFLTTAFATVCKDADLKAGVGQQITKIALSQAHGAADPVVYLSRGTLNIEYLWVKGEPAPDTAYVAVEIAARLRGEEAEAP